MSSKKKISISFRKENEEPKQEIVQAKQEQAAATDLKNNDDRSSYEKQGDSSQVYQLPFKKKRTSPIKYLMVSSLTALVISLGLGFLLLRMFVTLTDETTTGEGVVPATTQTTEQADQVSSTEAGVVIDSPAIQTYIVQVGVFSTEDKALEWKNKLIDMAVATMIWKRGGQFYLFAGNAQTESDAEVLAADLKARDVPTYVKSWSILKGEASFEGAGAQVVETVVPYLENHSLDSVSNSKREELISILEDKQLESSPLFTPLKEWSDKSQENLHWLKVAYALENVMK